MGDAAAVASASGALLREAVAPAADRADEGAAVNGASRSLVSRFTGGNSPGTIALVVLLGGGGLGAGSLLGSGPTKADMDAVKLDVAANASGVAAVTAAQSAAQISLLRDQNQQLIYNAGIEFNRFDNTRKLAAALQVVGSKLGIVLDLSISKLEVAR